MRITVLGLLGTNISPHPRHVWVDDFPIFAVWSVPSDRFLADTSQERSYMRPGIQLCWSRVQEISSRRGSFPLSLMHLWTNIRGSKETIKNKGQNMLKHLVFHIFLLEVSGCQLLPFLSSFSAIFLSRFQRGWGSGSTHLVLCHHTAIETFTSKTSDPFDWIARIFAKPSFFGVFFGIHV